MSTNSIIAHALDNSQTALSEYDSKALLEEYDVPVTRDTLVKTAEDAARAAGELGFPVVLKACGPDISHKTERELVAVGIRDEEELREEFDRIIVNLGDDPYEGIIVYSLVAGERELVIGLIRDPQFGPCVMFGLGGIFTEILKDTSFRVAPITEADALQMMDDIRARDILGPVRGKAPADKEKLARALVGLGRLGLEQEDVAEVDVNPLIIEPDGTPVAVDALVVLARPGD
ncbi:MAG: acetate--CoA ligase family protein [Actinobacteria bacterium]|nr:acetate--CoA ligase family protein [Actinomycetota bacterium]MCG2819634.1 acetate--CoA ligase family protein [Actinomycetes bacterium]MBU4217400.1 acetate--CoA ligase family protein [Actinomycetota bacterium]MBU4359962.1 acetate--CoA ligase family protein [Actinomycetota bacterium]MBU4393160.1 acetate--CoA ligase family protein [Actinomycetota bacterium]